MSAFDEKYKNKGGFMNDFYEKMLNQKTN